jgi:dimeric dUTPase (all-alpha-NTP-PPase superfamily)
MLGIKIKIVLIKAYHFIGIIKRYYSLIRRACLIIINEIYNINKNIVLQIAFKAINDFIRLNSLILILLIYSAYLQIAEHGALSPTII